MSHLKMASIRRAAALLIVALGLVILVAPVAAQSDAEPADAPAAGDAKPDQGPSESPAAGGDQPATPQAEPAPPARTPAAPETTAPAAQPAAQAAPQTTPRPDRDVKLVFNFRYAPWKDVLEWFAAQADLSLVYEVLPAGTFNYSDNHAYTPAQAIDLINSVLLTKGYTLVRHQRMLVLINLEEGVPPGLVSEVEVDELDEYGEYELVSVLFNISRAKPEEIELDIAKLIGPQGKVIVLPQAKQILVTETAGRLKTIRDVIDAIENPPSLTDSEVEVFTLKHITAEEALAVARPLLGLPEGQNVAPDESLRISLDPLGGRMLVSGKAEAKRKLGNILKLVDIPSDSAGPTAPDSLQLVVYSPGSCDPAVVLRVMQTLLAGEPEVRLETDQSTGNLVALARLSHHATIKATLDEMNRDGRQVEVIQLSIIDPQVAMLSINKLFGGGGEEGANPSAPKVEADPLTGQLIIRGSQTQIDQIRSMLQKMGESGDGPLMAGNGERSHLRTINISGAGARLALEQIEAIWPTMRQNRIRIVTPSSTIEERRPNGPEAPGEGPRRVDSGDAYLEWLRLSPLGDLLERPADSGTAPDSDSRRPAPAQPAPGEEQPADDQLDNSEGDDSEADDSESRTTRAARRIPAQFALAMFQEPPAATAPKTANPPQAEENSTPGAEIIIAPGPGGIVIASDDLDALDDFEMLLRSVVEQAMAASSQYTVFYLKYAEAPAAAALLQQVLGISSGDSGGGGGGGGGLLGGLASAALGGGGGMFDDLLGLGGGSGGLLSSSGATTIIADQRLNALVVQGSPEDIDLIEQMLRIIDQENSPEDVETIAKPRLIPVFNSNANDVLEVVKQVFSQQIASTGGGNQRQPSPEDFIRALRGGGEGGRGGRGGGGSDPIKMTVSVDPRSNSIVVAAPDPLFDQVRALVEQLDQAVEETDQTVLVVPLARSNPQVVQQALTSVLGSQVTSNSAASSNTGGGGDDDDNRRRSEEFQEQLRERVEAFNAMQRGGGDRGDGDRGGSRRGRRGR